MDSHVSTQEEYSPEKHDRPYRFVVTGVVSQNECARLRSLLQRQKKIGGYIPDMLKNESDSSLSKEFGEVSVPELMGVHGPSKKYNVQPEERKLLYQVMERIQAIAESKLNSTTIFLEYASMTVRRNPLSHLPKWHPKRLHYQTTGGHGMHVDQCGTGNRLIDTFTHGWECEFSKAHCCQQRTHSLLLYLNDDDQHQNDPLQGGDLYVVDRKDLLDETKPSYAGIGFAKLLQHTVRLKPTCGNLILFASDARNFHGTYPIQSGARVAMPMWWTLPKDIPDPSVTNDPDWLAVTRSHCEAYNKGLLPIPSGLEPYKGDCNAMIQAIKDEAYAGREE